MVTGTLGRPKLNLIPPKDIKENRIFRFSLNNQLAADEQAQQIVREMCRKDPAFFFNTFLWTYDPRKEPKDLPFILYDYQENYVRWLEEAYLKKEDTLTEKSRDMGVTWLIEGLIFMHWLFDSGFTAHFGSKTEDDVDRSEDPKSLFWKLRYFYRNLPLWLKPKRFDKRFHNMFMRFVNSENGSVITGESANPNFSRAGRYSVIFLDEFASQEYAEDIWMATADSSPCRIVVSTPQGTGNKFWDLRFNTPIKAKTLHWRLHPLKSKGLDQDKLGKYHSTWYDAECFRRSATDVAQELDINYLEAGNPFFSIEALQKQKEYTLGRVGRPRQYSLGNFVIEENRVAFREHPQGKIKLFEKPPKNGQYVIGADASEGVPEGDYSAFCAIEKKGINLVLGYRGKLKPDEFAYLIYLASRYLNNCMIACESAGYGHGVNENLWNLGANLYKDIDTSEGTWKQKTKLGFSVNPRTRPTILAQLDSEIRNNATELRDVLLINECKNFIVKDNKEQAAQGSSDDYIFARAIAGEVRRKYPFKIEENYRGSRKGRWGGKYTRFRIRPFDSHKYSHAYADRVAA